MHSIQRIRRLCLCQCGFFHCCFLSEVWKQLKTTALEISLSIYICVMCERAAQKSEKAPDMLGDCQEMEIVELTSVTSVRVAAYGALRRHFPPWWRQSYANVPSPFLLFFSVTKLKKWKSTEKVSLRVKSQEVLFWGVRLIACFHTDSQSFGLHFVSFQGLRKDKIPDAKLVEMVAVLKVPLEAFENGNLMGISVYRCESRTFIIKNPIGGGHS